MQRRWNMGSLHKALAAIRMVFLESVRSFGRNRDLESAATLAYYGFLSLIPLFLLVIFISSRVATATTQTTTALQELLTQLFPAAGDAVLKEVEILARQRVWGLLTTVALFWSITPLASAVRGAFSRIIVGNLSMSYLKAKLLDIVGALILLALFMLVVVGKVIQQALHARLGDGHYFFGEFLSFAGPPLLTVAGLALFFLAFASTRLRPLELVVGVATSTAALFILRPAFGWFLNFNPDYGYAFGSLKAAFLFLVWVYFSFAVILFSVEMMANTRRRDSLILRRFLDASPARRTAAPPLLKKFLRPFGPNDGIFREGDPGHEMYYVLSGSVLLTKGHTLLVRQEAGGWFGEMSMLIDATRTATATAGPEGAQLISISRRNFETLLADNPGIVMNILREMALRLKATDAKIPAAASTPAPAARTAAAAPPKRKSHKRHGRHRRDSTP